jgi:hypothetical protein
MKKTILSIFCLIFAMSAYSQEVESETEPETEQEETRKNRRHAIGFSAGTGFAFDYSYKLNESFTVTARYNVLDYEVKELEQEVDGEELLIDATIDFKNIDVFFSYYPFKSSFRLIGGIGSFSNNTLNVVANFKNSVNIGDVEFNSDDIGELNITTVWKKTAPYAGIGFGRAVPKNKRLGFGLEIGTYFAGSPDVTLEATGLIEQTKDQEALLQESFSELKFIPYISFRLSYSL